MACILFCICTCTCTDACIPLICACFFLLGLANQMVLQEAGPEQSRASIAVTHCMYVCAVQRRALPVGVPQCQCQCRRHACGPPQTLRCTATRASHRRVVWCGREGKQGVTNKKRGAFDIHQRFHDEEQNTHHSLGGHGRPARAPFHKARATSTALHWIDRTVLEFRSKLGAFFLCYSFFFAHTIPPMDTSSAASAAGPARRTPRTQCTPYNPQAHRGSRGT